MIWPFSKGKKKKGVPVRRIYNSLFSSHIDGEVLESFFFEQLWTRSFQKLPAQFKAINKDGQPVESAPRPRASTPAIGRFAMDSPSAGNVLSMKPILDPSQLLPAAQFAYYASQSFIGYQVCAMLAQHWFMDKVCVTPPSDAIRHGFELGSDDDQDIDDKVLTAIRKADKRYKIKNHCVEFVQFNRIFGIRHALPIIDDPDPNYYLKPFDINRVKPGSYKGISQIDPYWITPELDGEAAANPASMHFYEPTWWRINGQRIHRTHLIIARNSQVADILKPTYYYGGVSMPQKIAERLYAAERTANEGPQLAQTKRTTFMNVDITQALANLQEFLQKMSFYSQTRDNYGVKVGGLEDKFTQFDTSLSDFDDMTMMQFTLACAAADCPTTKIMGTSPKGGLGSEGEYDADSYHEFLETLQSHHMEPLIERHHQLLMASEIIPKMKSQVPPDWQPTILWNSTETLGAKQKAEVNEIKARTGNDLVNSGAIDGVDERDRLITDDDSGYNGLADREPEIMDLTGEEDTTGNIKSAKSEAGEKD